MEIVLPIMGRNSVESVFNDLFNFESVEEFLVGRGPRLLRSRSLRCPYQRLNKQRSVCEEAECCRKLKSKTDKSVIATKDNYMVNVDVQNYQPEEITLKVVGDNTISIEAKHEEKTDNEHVYHHFMRKYTLPEGYDINKINSKLTTDGKLTIVAPKILPDSITEREIPIEFSKDNENSSTEKTIVNNVD